MRSSHTKMGGNDSPLVRAEKNANIMPFCMSDRMSTIAAKILMELGYTNVWNFQSGLASWEHQGYTRDPGIQKVSALPVQPDIGRGGDMDMDSNGTGGGQSKRGGDEFGLLYSGWIP